jgi:hypothetical protein
LISHTLSTVDRKEDRMNTIALTLLLLVRVLIPLAILLTLGEWSHRHEKNYWLRM